MTDLATDSKDNIMGFVGPNTNIIGKQYDMIELADATLINNGGPTDDIFKKEDIPV